MVVKIIKLILVYILLILLISLVHFIQLSYQLKSNQKYFYSKFMVIL